MLQALGNRPEPVNCESESPAKKVKTSSLYLDKESSDVTLIVAGHELPAHKSVLTEGSEYFKTMFSSSFFEATADKIVLKETKLRAFKIVLKRIYVDADGNKDYHTLTQLFDILACARFYMVDNLISPTISEIKSKSDDCLGTVLSKAIAHFEDELISYITDEIQKNANDIIKIYKQLSPEAMEHLLKVTLHTRESTIFEALVGWMRYNFNSSDESLRLLEYIDLPLLDENQFDLLFKPSQLVDRDLFQNLLNQQREKAKPIQKVVNQNVVKGLNELRIVEGFIGERKELLPLEGKTDVIIDLKQQFLLNCLKMKSSHYAVSVSTDMRSWELVFNYLDCYCIGQQVLYFDELVVRFIRFQRKLENKDFSVSDIEATYSTNEFNYDPDTTMLIPTQNLFATEGDENLLEDFFVNGVVYEDGDIGYLFVYDGASIIAHRSQPYLVDSIKIMLPELCSYRMEISTDKKHWRKVKVEKNVIGWRTVRFRRRPVVFIKITGLEVSSDYFLVRNIECPAYIKKVVPKKKKTTVSHNYALRKRKATQA